MNDFTETRLNTHNNYGIVSAGGSLFPNSKINFRDMTDGSSNVIVVGETSDFLNNTIDWRPSHAWGWQIGCKDPRQPPNFDVATAYNGTDSRIFNMVTLRYAVNRRSGWSNNKAALGVGDNGAANIPLTSAHAAGGVNVLMGDGAVRFIGSNTSPFTLGALATRNDGQTLGEF